MEILGAIGAVVAAASPFIVAAMLGAGTAGRLPRAAVSLACLGLALAAVNARRPMLDAVLVDHGLAVEPGFEGLAVNTAVVILWTSLGVVVLLAHGLARFVDTRWTGAGDSLSRRPATVGVHVATFALFGAALFTSAEARPIAAALPDPLLVAAVVGAGCLGAWTRRDAAPTRRLLAALVAASFAVLATICLGRWF